MIKQRKVGKSEEWFVEPSVVRLDIGDGHWLDVKRELTVGESMAVQQRLIKTVRADGRIEPDLKEVWKANICAYIVHWSLMRNGSPVKFTFDAVDNLSKSSWERISAAVLEHIEAGEAAMGKLGGSMSSTDLPSAE
jgi:hypothetical protein